MKCKKCNGRLYARNVMTIYEIWNDIVVYEMRIVMKNVMDV